MLDLLEFDGQRDGVEENINLEDAEEEEAEMFKHLGKEIPEEADVRSEVRNRETGGRENSHIRDADIVTQSLFCLQT